MIATDEDALICDFAECYHIYDYRGLPVQYAAVLACGLRDDSRIKMAISSSVAKPDTLILAAILDRLSLLLWAKTEDGARGRNRPASLTEQLLGTGTRNDNVVSFASAEDFELARANIIERVVNSNA